MASKKKRRKVVVKQSDWVDIEPDYVPSYQRPNGAGAGYSQYPAVMVGEETGDHIVFTYGRFNPPTIGHEAVVNKLKSIASEEKGTPLVITSHSQDADKNPLSPEYKISLLNKAFGDIVHPEPQHSLIDAFKLIESKGAKKATILVGSDREKEVHRAVKGTNGKDYNIPEIKIVVAGDRDSHYNDVTAASATKAREAAKDGDVEKFKSLLPVALHDDALAIMSNINNVNKRG